MAVKLTSPMAVSYNQIISKVNNFEPVWSNSESTDNRLYWGDNLDVLKNLITQSSICGQVRLIYIDPPYNVGGYFQTRDFKHAYSDNLTKESYVSFMKERLLLLHSLMANDGSIYVHLDSNMVFHIKVLMDDIFGEQNFRGMITRKKCKPKNYTKKTFGNVSDYILYYTKTESPLWNRPYDKWSNEKMLKEYPFVEKETGRRYKRVPIHAPGKRNGDSGKPWRGILPPEGKHWQYTPDTLEEMDAKGEIYWSSNGNPRRKVYFDESNGIPVQDIWLDFLDADNQNTKITGYPTEKNPLLLQRIIEASSNPGDIVLDCFAGSGTTLSVASDLNRQWIGVDIGDVAIETILNRFYRGRATIQEYDKKKSNNFQQDSITLFDCSENNTESDVHRIVPHFTFYAPYDCPVIFRKLLEKICPENMCKSLQ